MEENLGEHIGAAELANLLEESRLRGENLRDPSEVHPHLAACPTCREQFEGLALLDRQLQKTRSPKPVQRQGDCPRPEVWHEIAIGLTPPDQTLVCVEHASRCDHCGPMLRDAVAELTELNQEMTEAERKSIAALDSARPEWQQRLAERITAAPNPKPDQKSAPSWRTWLAVPRLAVAGVSLLAVVGVASWVVIRQHEPASADRLLAAAYTQKRTLELRIAGAGYAPLRVSLGPAASFTSRPPALLKAEALIAGELQSHPSDPSWLEAKAQADVLEGRHDAAVQSLRRALELSPHSPALLTDLATAYFQRAQQEDHKDDFGAAYEYLSQALRLRPDDPVALFNRAIVSEHEFLYQQALDDWNHYLRVDASSQWADEARNRRNAVQQKLKEHESKATPLLDPGQIAAGIASPGLASEVDGRIDEYLLQAVRSWLPDAFPESKANSDPNALRALFFLADLTIRQHHDRWLADLLRGSSEPHFAQAANALARAVDANQTGDYDLASREAGLAQRQFRAQGNPAGALRAVFEQSWAAQLMRRGETCRREAMTGLAESEKYPYPWLQIQLELEKAVGFFLSGHIGADEEATGRALDRAHQTGYHALYLRAIFFAADDKLRDGDQRSAISLADNGLNLYWSGQFRVIRGRSLYTVMSDAAEAANQPNLLVALRRENVALADSSEEAVEQRALAHRLLADAATAAGMPQVAEQQYAEAARLFAAAPHTTASRNDALVIEILRARVEAYQGQFDNAISRLTGIQDQIRPLSDNFTQMFYSTLGELQLARHRYPEAEQAFRPALRLAEQNLASLASEVERTSWTRDSAPIYLGLAEAELLQGRQQESLDMFEWYMGAPQRAAASRPANRSRPSEPSQFSPDTSRLPAVLPLLWSQTVLAYGVLPDGLAIWLYDNRGVNAKWIPKSPRDLQDLADRFYVECSDPHSEPSALRRDSQTLYSLLIAPIEEQLDPKRTLTIEAEGFLARLPFEALMDSNGHYLIERASVVHSPGLYPEEQMHSAIAISRDLPALIVGSEASSPDAGLFVIPNIRAGLDAVAGDFHSPRVLTGADATLDAVTKALPAAAVFHFTGHALTTSNRAGLMLEDSDKDKNNEDKDAQTGARRLPDDPSVLDASVLRSLNLQNLQLAVLAACNTDSGEGGSRGFDSVAQALQTSGVPHVLASRWAVDAVEASAFMNSFYASALSGQPVSAATRVTSEKMLSDPRTAHPYYWAAFAAYGRP